MTLHPRLIAILCCAALLSGCAGDKPVSNNVFDFGPAVPVAATARPAIAAVVVTDVTGTAAHDSERMYYRLNYADALEARTYANSRWSATPLQLLTQRLKVRFSQAGLKVLSGTDASNGVAILRVEVDDFNHAFDSVAESKGQVSLRASLFHGHKLIDQKSFQRHSSANAANAAGGARALAASTDAIAADMLAWLATLPPAAQ